MCNVRGREAKLIKHKQTCGNANKITVITTKYSFGLKIM